MCSQSHVLGTCTKFQLENSIIEKPWKAREALMKQFQVTWTNVTARLKEANTFYQFALLMSPMNTISSAIVCEVWTEGLCFIKAFIGKTRYIFKSFITIMQDLSGVLYKSTVCSTASWNLKQRKHPVRVATSQCGQHFHVMMRLYDELQNVTRIYLYSPRTFILMIFAICLVEAMLLVIVSTIWSVICSLSFTFFFQLWCY